MSCTLLPSHFVVLTMDLPTKTDHLHFANERHNDRHFDNKQLIRSNGLKEVSVSRSHALHNHTIGGYHKNDNTVHMKVYHNVCKCMYVYGLSTGAYRLRRDCISESKD